jgi:hypothetical protein
MDVQLTHQPHQSILNKRSFPIVKGTRACWYALIEDILVYRSCKPKFLGFHIVHASNWIHNIAKGYLVDDTLIVEEKVGAQRVVDYLCI